MVIDGRISIQEDADMSIVANSITELKVNKKKEVILNITDLDEDKKAKLRGAIKFFVGERNNMPISVKQNDKISSCGAIFATDEILEEFKNIVGENNYELTEV